MVASNDYGRGLLAAAGGFAAHFAFDFLVFGALPLKREGYARHPPLLPGVEIKPRTEYFCQPIAAMISSSGAPKRVLTRDPSYTLNQTGIKPRAGHLAGALWKTLTTPQDEPS